MKAHGRAAVFGGSGLIGRHIVRKLAAAGMQVVAASRRPDHELRTLGPSGAVTPLACDVRNPRAVRQAAFRADMVINCTGVLHETPRASFRRVYGEAAENVALAAREAGACSLVQLSALGVGVDMKSRYMQARAEGESRVRNVFPGASFIRPSVVLGDGGFLRDFERLSRYLPVLPLILGGATRFMPVAAEDVAEAAVRCAFHPGLGADPICAVGDDVFTLLQLQQAVVDLLGRRRLFVPAPLFLMSAMAVVAEKLLPCTPITYDQIQMLKTDNLPPAGAQTLRDIGMAPLPALAVMRRVLVG